MLSSLLKHREALLGAVIILMIVAIGSRVPSFIAPDNLVEMFNDTAIRIVLALGQMMVLLPKGIDLSMAANLALTGMIVALINFHYPDVPVWALLILASVLGLLMGAINGLLVWKLGIPAIVVTLGTTSIYRGMIFALRRRLVNSNQMVQISRPATCVSAGQPVLSWCAIAALLLVGYFLRYSRTGRALYTAGGNATAAYYTGINAGKMHSSLVSAFPVCRPEFCATCGYRALPLRMLTSLTVLNCRWWQPV
ncbi:MAG: ABC transporter permease [Enterobacter hormaechei]